MPNVGKLKEELDDLMTLKFISSAFTEASMVKLQKIRVQFEQNQEFYADMSQVYHIVRVSGEEELKKKKEKQKETPKQKVLSVALTSNQRFYGSINVNIMRTFIADVRNADTDITVIGTTGRDFMRSQGFPRKFKRIVFTKEEPTKEEVRNFLEETRSYDIVYVYYPQFKSLVRQEPAKIDITQKAAPDRTVREEERHILFEPEYSKILEFFDRQVRSLLFLRVLLEADLARTAARMISMSSAEERSGEMIKEKRGEIRKLQTSIVNRQLLETFAGIAQWKNK